MSDLERKRPDPDVGKTIVDRPRPTLARPDTRARMIQVEVVGGPMDGQERWVNSGTLTIGRGEGNDLVLPLDRSVSTRHARIVVEGRNYWLEDLDSTNGTFLGDERLRQRTVIGPGTIFVVGRTKLELFSR